MHTHSQIEPNRFQPSILWLPLISLAAVYAAVTLSWVIYRIHLPGLLSQFGLSEQLAPQLLLIEFALAVAIEPIAGLISDRLQWQQGNRFPIITLGVTLTAFFFVTVPALVVLLPATATTRWLLPALLIAWGIAISLFRVPAVAFLRRYAQPAYLPLAAAALTVGAGLAGATTPLGSPLILGLGAPLTFTVAALLLLGTIAIFRSLNPPAPRGEAAQGDEVVQGVDQVAAVAWLRLGAIFGVGFGVTLAFRMAIETFPKILKAAGMTPPTFVGLIFLSLAIVALPLGWVAVKLSNRRAMVLGFGSMAVFLGFMPMVQNSFGAVCIALGLGVSFALISNGTLPFALSLLSSRQAGLSIGMFFSGAAMVAVVFMGFLSKPGVLNPTSSLWLGILALGLACLCVVFSHSTDRLTQQRSV